MTGDTLYPLLELRCSIPLGSEEQGAVRILKRWKRRRRTPPIERTAKPPLIGNARWPAQARFPLSQGYLLGEVCHQSTIPTTIRSLASGDPICSRICSSESKLQTISGDSVLSGLAAPNAPPPIMSPAL